MSQSYYLPVAANRVRQSKRLQNRFDLIQIICYMKFMFVNICKNCIVLVVQPKQMVALRPPPVADKGSNALSEITSNRKHIYVQRIATIFQTGEHGSPLQTMHNFHHIKTILLNINFHQGGRPMNAPTFKQQLSYKNIG